MNRGTPFAPFISKNLREKLCPIGLTYITHRLITWVEPNIFESISNNYCITGLRICKAHSIFTEIFTSLNTALFYQIFSEKYS